MTEIQTIVQNQRLFFQSNQTRSYAYRKDALLNLKKHIITHEKAIVEALYQDLGKSDVEGYLTEIGVTLIEINHTLKHLKTWMKPKKVQTPLPLFKASSILYPEPCGNVLIFSPWNYPFQLTMAPLIGAIAAGNTAILKVSPDSIHTARLMKTMIEELFDSSYITVIIGDIEESQALLKERFDHIFFTGSTHVGKIVMQEAAKNLIPVTLELGGKSPALVDGTTSLDLAAKRIIYGKIINSGQTCIAPDYVLIHKESLDEWVSYSIKHIQTFFDGNPLNASFYPKIINQKHYNRLVSLLKDGKILYGGGANGTQIEPTLMTNIKPESPLLNEEIFGPILPIFSYETEEEALRLIQSMEKPLAFYPFTQNKNFLKKLVETLSFGGATINDTLMHFGNKNLPFGGVGHSGMGRYHGRYSFETFSHHKAIVKRSLKVDLPFRYPPYESKILRWIKKLIG